MLMQNALVELVNDGSTSDSHNCETAPLKPRCTKNHLRMVEGFICVRGNIRKGDVLIVGSVSGYNKLPVELVLAAREMGVKTIALTTVEYSEKLTSKHPSGKRLFEVADIVLDNCSNFSDTLVEVPAINRRICPSSGIGAAYIMWALQAAVVEKLVAKGLNPSVYISNHMPNAGILNDEAWKNYEKNGY